MADNSKTKEQRDRFLAFAFASADLFLELDSQGLIAFALGAGKSITGIAHDNLIGKPLSDLLSRDDHPRLMALIAAASPGRRFGPAMFRLAGGLGMDRGLFSGIKMPGKDHTYITVSLSNELMDRLDQGGPGTSTPFNPTTTKPDPKPLVTEVVFRDEKFDDSVYGQSKLTPEKKFDDSAYGQSKLAPEKKFDDSLYAPPPPDMNAALMPKSEFLKDSAEAFEWARTQDKNAGLTVFDFGRTETIPEENWADTIGEMAKLLRASAIDGNAAAQIGEGRFSLIHGDDVDTAALAQQMSDIAKEKDPAGQGLDIKSKTMEADFSRISVRQATRALIYTINEFERSGLEMTPENLSAGFDTYMNANTDKARALQDFLDRSDFSMHFQPIVDMVTRECSHYEMLCRFSHGRTQEWISFAEDIGMAPRLDLAVFERAVNYVTFKAGGTRTKYAINLSGQTLPSEKFMEKLTEVLIKHKALPSRILFEITESCQIEDMDQAAGTLRRFREMGFEVALDDFGAGAASFQYLQKFDVDYVKIDGKYTGRILHSERDAAMLRNLARLCEELNIKVIAEFVETKEQLNKLLELGIKLGQGYFFGKPETRPSYHKNPFA